MLRIVVLYAPTVNPHVYTRGTTIRALSFGVVPFRAIVAAVRRLIETHPVASACLALPADPPCPGREHGWHYEVGR